MYLSRDGDVLLGDFGIARKVTGRTLRPDETSAIKGKYGYLAPEQVNAEGADHRADLFSLGVCLAELLLGGPLFEGDADFAVLLSIRDGRIDNLNRLSGKIPDGLLAVLRRVLARRPEDRFRSAGELAEALRAYLPRTPRVLSRDSDRGSWFGLRHGSPCAVVPIGRQNPYRQRVFTS